MRALKAFFLGRLLREKLLLVVFVALGALMWLSNFATRASAAWRSARTTSIELAQQKQWLVSRDAIEASAVQAVKNLDPSKTLDETRLVGELSSMARENELKFTNDTPQTERTGEFAIHTVQINLQTHGQNGNAEWAQLRTFYFSLSRRAPYMGIEQFIVASNRSNPNLLSASLKVSSVEIIR